MNTTVYSNPFVHTAYYFREMFRLNRSENMEPIKDLFRHKFGHPIESKDFAFNENVNCERATNGIFMRLNGCSLLKLRHWCLYPNQPVAIKIVQYVARIFLSPIAAVADLAINVTLFPLKIAAWPIMRICVEWDNLSSGCYYSNLYWQMRAIGDSIWNLGSSCFGSITWSLAGPYYGSSLDMSLWGYRTHHYQGPHRPFIYDDNFPFLAFELDDNFNAMKDHYAPWFQTGQIEILFDPYRVKYLKDHCGWDDLSDDELKRMNIEFPTLKNVRVAFHTHENLLTLIVNGKYSWLDRVERIGNTTIEYWETKEILRRLAIPI